MSVQDAVDFRLGRGLKYSVPEAYPATLPFRKPIWPLVDLAEDYVQPSEGTYIKMPKSLSMVDPDSEGLLDTARNGESSKSPESTTTPRVPEKLASTISPTATNRVLNTTELLENILSHLPILNLYLARQISYPFRDLIDTSPSLRNKISNSSGPPELPSRVSGRVLDQFALNPILIHLNLFNRLPFSNCPDCGNVSAGCLRHEPSGYQHHLATITFPPRWRIKDAKWRECQICEPPIKRVFLRSSWLEKYIDGLEGKGVTAGQLADILEFQTGRLYFWHST